MTTAAVERRLSRSALEEYLASPAPAVITVPGTPTCHVLIDPTRTLMTLRVHTTAATVVDLADFEHVTARRILADGLTWSELTVDSDGRGHEAYLLLSDVSDMIQQQGLAFDVAVRTALSTFEALLTRAGRLTAEQQLGLYGELLFLECCLHSAGADHTHAVVDVVEAWKGSTAHEHDFVLPGACFEIKTTRAERRRHRISGLEQLQPVPGVPLWLVSVQVTAAAPGSGRTLGELVAAVRGVAGPARDSLDAALGQAGWRERDRPLYRDRLRLRSVPAAYPVDDHFPVLDRAAVDAACTRPELIVDASYTIDVTTFRRAIPPPPATGFVEGDS